MKIKVVDMPYEQALAQPREKHTPPRRPSMLFRALLRARGVRFVLSSDAHAAEGLDCAFDRFAALSSDGVYATICPLRT